MVMVVMIVVVMVGQGDVCMCDGEVGRREVRRTGVCVCEGWEVEVVVMSERR